MPVWDSGRKADLVRAAYRAGRGSAPARAAASMTAPAARACVPGKIVDFCRAVPPGHGFRLANGAFTTIDGPGASLTVPYRSNNRGQVVGAYVDAAGKSQHFQLDKGGFTPIDYPGAAFTVPFDINDRDQVVGSYLDAAGKPQGFLLDDGVYTVIDTAAFPSAQLLGLNDRGEIVGGYLDPDGKVRGLLRDAKGSFTTFSAPQAVSQTGGWTSTIDARSSASSAEQPPAPPPPTNREPRAVPGPHGTRLGWARPGHRGHPRRGLASTGFDPDSGHASLVAIPEPLHDARAAARGPRASGTPLASREAARSSD
jgi:hypothetical protein